MDYGKCWKCDKPIKRIDALSYWAVNNDVDRSVAVHKSCWLELRQKHLGIPSNDS